MSTPAVGMVELPGPRTRAELLRLEQLLRRRDQEFAALADRSDDLISEFDRELRYVYINPALERLTGCPAADFIGRRHDELALAPTLAARLQERLTAVLASRQESELEFEWQAAHESSPRVYRARLIPEISADGVIEAVLVISRDITARLAAERDARRSEQYFRALLEDSSDLMAVLDQTGAMMYASPSARRLLGYRPELLLGRPARDLVHPEDAGRVEAIIAESLRTPGVIQSVEVQLRQIPDRWRLFELVGKGVVLECGSPIIVFNGRDITDRRRLELQLRQTQKIESIGRLAGGIAHDFNNILATILTNCELLRDETAAETPVRAGIDEIAGAAERAASLTQQLLAFSRRQVLQPKVLELNALVQEFEVMLRRLLGSDVEWRFLPDPALGAVAVDRTQMEQVLLNLAVNAREAMPEGGRLTVATVNLDVTEPMTREMPGLRPGAYVVISMRDTGHGMDAATASNIFEPFFTTKDAGHGAGLGLATVYGIVKQSGGYIAVDTTLAQGAEFRIYLPRVARPAAPTTPTPVDQAVASKPRGKESILLVEDEPSVRRVTVRLLERLGYRTLVAERPDQALAIARDKDQTIDLVISDVVMPLMRGPALVREMFALRPGLKAVLISGYALDSSEPSVGLEPGVSFLRKPFSISELSQLVRRQLDGEPLP